ncbi:hypothetical protein H5U35_04065, partial [Candidatus Aerophobetes bacterium]|nr:hypothetical protein [Candidatus Aerophobetes bacterium]
ISHELLRQVLSIDWISIFFKLKNNGIFSHEFKFKYHEGKIELATRQGDFLPEWKGYVILQKEPLLHLARLNGIGKGPYDNQQKKAKRRMLDTRFYHY